MNETNQTMTKSAFAHGISNAVCNDQAPHDSIAPNSEDQWAVGDNLFSTCVTIRYRLTNGDEVELHVYAEKGNLSAPLSCAWTQVVSSPLRLTATRIGSMEGLPARRRSRFASSRSPGPPPLMRRGRVPPPRVLAATHRR